MARSLGTLFSEPALAPLDAAGSHLSGRDVEAALAELTRERLIGAMRRGVEQAAKAAAVKPLEVFQRLPMPDLEAVVERLEADLFLIGESRGGRAGTKLEPPAPSGPTRAWAAAELADGLRQLTQSAEAQGNFELRSALGELADDAAAWHLSLDQCRALLDHAEDLTRRHRRRRLIRFAAWSTIPLLLLAAGAGFTYRHLARARVDAVLDQGGCPPGQVAKRDLALASDAQVAALREQQRRCREKEEAERLAAEKKRAAEAERREKEKRRQEQLARCESLRQRFEQNELDESDDKLAGEHAELIRRLAKGVIRPADVEGDLSGLPCPGTPAAKAIGSAYARLVAAETSIWLRTRVPSKSAQQLVVEHRAAIDPTALQYLGGHIDVAASRAVLSGQKEDIERFAELCRWTRALEAPRLGNCIAVLELAEQP